MTLSLKQKISKYKMWEINRCKIQGKHTLNVDNIQLKLAKSIKLLGMEIANQIHFVNNVREQTK